MSLIQDFVSESEKKLPNPFKLDATSLFNGYRFQSHHCHHFLRRDSDYMQYVNAWTLLSHPIKFSLVHVYFIRSSFVSEY